MASTLGNRGTGVVDSLEACGVSDTTVLRFCRSVGFRGLTGVELAVALAAGSALDVSVLGDHVRANLISVSGSAAEVAIGTSIDRDGNTWNPVDPDRVDRIMDAVRTLR